MVPLIDYLTMAGVKDKLRMSLTGGQKQSRSPSSCLDSGFGSEVGFQTRAQSAKDSNNCLSTVSESVVKVSERERSSLQNLIDCLIIDIKELVKAVATLTSTVNHQAKEIQGLKVSSMSQKGSCHCSARDRGSFEPGSVSGNVSLMPNNKHLVSLSDDTTTAASLQPHGAVFHDTVARPQVQSTQRRLLFPKLEDSVSFNQYVLNVSSCVEAFSDMGHDDGLIARDLHQFLVQGELSSQFLHQLGKQKKKGLLSTADVILALKRCHLENALSSPWERFKNLRKLKKERLSGFLMRCEQYSQDVPFLIRNPEAQRWHIKMQFLRGARIPEKMHDRLLPYASLGEFLLACKRLLHQDRVYSNPVSKSEVVQGPWSRAGSAAPSFRHRSASQISTKVAKQHNINNSKTSILPSLLSFKPTMFTPLMANFQTFL